MSTASRAAALATVAAALGFSGPGRAEIVSSAPYGFELREVVHVAAAPARVYATLVRPARWWSSQHTYSGDAANLTLEPRAGGCWCERLKDGGSVQHMTVVFAQPGKALRLRGALGPLQAMGVEGALSWSLKAAGDGTDLTVTYAVGGYCPEGADELAGAVDGVLAEQVARLQAAVEGSGPAGKRGPR